MKQGRHFADEIEAAGLSDIPRHQDGEYNFIFGDGVTAQQETAFMAVVDAHDPDADPMAYVKDYPDWTEVMEALIEHAEGRPEKLAIVSQKRATAREGK